MLKNLFALSLLLAVAACSNSNNPPPVISDGAVIQWDRSPDSLVFRSDVTGGSRDEFLTRSEIPPCTIYGDNRVVWTNELGPFNTQVLEDRLTDDQIRNFVSFLQINKEFFRYTAKGDQLPASEVQPAVETLTLSVNGFTHKTDAFGGWTLDYYDEVTRACREISLAPVLYVPQAGWLSAKAVPYDPQFPSVYWDAAANALSLGEIATRGERTWIIGRTVPVIWNLLRESPPTIQLVENEQQYRIALEIPNVTRNSPAAPQQ
jgi:hypothetical protein